MSLAEELIALANEMVKYTKSAFQDALLRRAVSTAYYALFHRLLEEGAARIVNHSGVRHLVGRSFVHSDMYKAAKSFVSGPANLPSPIKAAFGGTVPPFPPEIITVANAFVALQEARHEADYDLGKTISLTDAKKFVSQAESAMKDWATAKAIPANAIVCELFLAALLLNERWRK